MAAGTLVPIATTIERPTIGNPSVAFTIRADQTLKVWGAVTGKCLVTLQVDGTLHDCACSADGEIIAAAGARGTYFLRLVR